MAYIQYGIRDEGGLYLVCPQIWLVCTQGVAYIQYALRGGLYSVYPQGVAYIQYALRDGLYSVCPQVVAYIQYALRGGLYSVCPQGWPIFSGMDDMSHL